MKFAHIICLLLLIISSHSILDHNMIIDFCNSKNLTSVTIYSCLEKKEVVNLIKSFSSIGFNVLILDLRQFTYNLDSFVRWKRSLSAFILDGDCPNVEHFFNETKRHYFSDRIFWFIISIAHSIEIWLQLLQNISLNINSNLHLAINIDNLETRWTIYDVYNPAFEHGGELKVNQLGYYSKEMGYNMKIKENKYWTRRNMTGVHFRSAVVVPDFRFKLDEFLTSELNREQHSMHRFQSMTVRYCRDMYNFTMNIQRTNSWGYMQSWGHFDGLVGLLERKEVDFGSSPLLYKLDRMPFVDYSYGNWILRSAFIYRRPKIEAASYQIFLRPLSKIVWLYIVFFMGLIVLALKLVFSREKVLLRELNNQFDSSWSSLILFTLGAFCQQGATCYPQLISSRTLSVFVFFFCILIYQFYSASIVSYLLMDPPRVINNLKDLTDSNLKTGIEDILIDRNYFLQTTDPVAIELFEKKIKGKLNSTGFFDPDEGLNLVRMGGFAYHVETSTAYPIIANTFTNEEICELEEVQMYRTQPMYTNLQKNSPFREMMNYCMLSITERGLMDRLRKYWNTPRPICIESAKKITIHVGIHEFSCGLIVLSYGILFALLFLIYELIIYNKAMIVAKLKHYFKGQLLPFVE